MGNIVSSPEDFIHKCDLQEIQQYAQQTLKAENNEEHQPDEEFFYEAAFYACSSKTLAQQKVQCILSIFFHAGLDFHRTNPNVHEWTCLHYACAAHNYFLIPFLLDVCKLRPYTRDNCGLLPIDFVPRYHYNDSSIQLLLERIEVYHKQYGYRLMILPPETEETSETSPNKIENEKENIAKQEEHIQTNKNPEVEMEESCERKEVAETMSSNIGNDNNIHEDTYDVNKGLRSSVYESGDIVHLKYEVPEGAYGGGYLQLLYRLESETFLDAPHYGSSIPIKHSGDNNTNHCQVSFPTQGLPETCFCQFVYVLSDSQFLKRQVVASTGPILLQPNFGKYCFKVGNEIFYTQKHKKIDQKEFSDLDELNLWMEKTYGKREGRIGENKEASAKGSTQTSKSQVEEILRTT